MLNPSTFGYIEPISLTLKINFPHFYSGFIDYRKHGSDPVFPLKYMNTYICKHTLKKE